MSQSAQPQTRRSVSNLPKHQTRECQAEAVENSSHWTEAESHWFIRVRGDPSIRVKLQSRCGHDMTSHTTLDAAAAAPTSLQKQPVSKSIIVLLILCLLISFHLVIDVHVAMKGFQFSLGFTDYLESFLKIKVNKTSI